MKTLLLIFTSAVLCAQTVHNGGTAIPYANAASTGTTVNKLAKLTGAPSTAVIAATSDTSGIIGIVGFGAGTTGTAQIIVDGLGYCAFDGATTAGHYVGISSAVAGDCHDAGASFPTTGQVLGVVTSTNGSAGTYMIDMSLRQPSASGGSSQASVIGGSLQKMTEYRTGTVSYTALTAAATSQEITLISGVPERWINLHATVQLVTTFICSGLSTLTGEMAVSGAGANMVPPINLFGTAVSTWAPDVPGRLVLTSRLDTTTGTYSIVALFKANANLSAGSCSAGLLVWGLLGVPVA